jgi:hypothetical protein
MTFDISPQYTRTLIPSLRHLQANSDRPLAKSEGEGLERIKSTSEVECGMRGGGAPRGRGRRDIGSVNCANVNAHESVYPCEDG